jgi:hypothetical protein
MKNVLEYNLVMNMNEPPKKPEPGEILPEGFTNWPKWKQQAHLEGKPIEDGEQAEEPKQEDGPEINTPDYSSSEVKEEEKATDPELEKKFELVKKLKDTGIKIEMVDALPNLAIYDEGEKTLRVRRDASFSFVEDYVNNSVFAEQEGVDQLPDEDRNDYISLEDDEGDEKNEVVEEDKENKEKPFSLDDLDYKPKSEEETEKEKEELAEKIKSAQNLDELYTVLRGAGGVQGSRGRFYGAESLIAEIEGVKQMVEAGDAPNYGRILTEITSGAGLRDKVKELIIGKKEEKPVNAEVLPPEPKVSETIPSPIVGVKAEEVPAKKAEQPEASQQESTSNWRESEEWKEFEKIEKDVAGARAQKRGKDSMLGMDANLDNLEDAYEYKRKQIASMIESDYREKKGLDEGPLLREQQKELNDLLWGETVQGSKKRREEHIDALRAGEDKNWKDKGLEVLRKATKIKVVEWYLKQGKKTRAAINTAIFGAAIGAGTFIGGGAASVALGAVVYRGARAAGSILGAGGGVGVDKFLEKRGENNPEAKIKFKKIETVDKEEKEEIEKIKNDNFLSAKDKETRFAEIKNKYNKERKLIIMRKAGMAIGGGLLGGSAVGGILDFAYGGTGYRVESQGGKGGGTTEPSAKPAPEVAPAKPPITEANQHAQSNPETPTPELAVEPKPPSILKHQNVEGDSTWKILEKTLENDEKFKGLTEAQKTFVVSNFANKIIENPDTYGVSKGGSLEIGKETDLTKLFEDSKEAESIFEKAKEVVKEGSMREKTILENNAKIATWVADPNNKGKVLDESRVSEILNTKPKQFFTGEQAKEFLSQAEKPKSSDVKLSESLRDGAFAETDEKVIPGSIEELMQDKMDALKTPEHNEFSTTETGVKEAAAQVEETAINNTEVAERLTNRIWTIENMKNGIDPTDTSKMSKFEALLKEAESLKSKIMLGEEVPEVQKTLDEIEKQAHEIINSKPNGVAENVINIKDARAGIEDEIDQYKQRLAQLENNRAAVTSGAAAVAAAPVVAFSGREGFNSNIRTLRSDIEASKNNEEGMVASALNAGVHDIYGSEGLMGIGKKEGINTPEWKWIAKLPAAKLVKYYSGNSNESGLPPQTMETLSKSKKHGEFAKQMLDLIKRAESIEDKRENIDARPFENENTEQFMRRLLEYILPKSNSQNLQKAA